MKMKRIVAALAVLLMMAGLPFAGTALAEDSYSASSTSYAFMGGSYKSAEQNYFIAGPMEYEFSDEDMWGFATIKFSEIGDELVSKAYLKIELLGVGSMNYAAASTDYPAVVEVYSPGDTDVASLTKDSAATLHEDLKDSDSGTTSLLTTVTMTSNGVWSIDITDIYNEWATGASDNNGLVLICGSPNENEAGGATGAVGAVFAGLTGVGKADSTGLAAGTTAPSITTEAYVTPVPQITPSLSGTVNTNTVTLTISGDGVDAYRYKLDDAADWSDAIDPSQSLTLSELSDGEHTLVIQVRDTLGDWQTDEEDTITLTWTVQTTAVTPPTVSATTPGSDATGVSVDTEVTVTFDKVMDTTSVEQAFSMTPGTGSVSGSFAWNDANTLLTFTPANLLASQTAYTVTIGTDAADSDGNTLASAYSFSFTTDTYVEPDPEVSGVPEGDMDTDTATLTISGDGVEAYRYKLDDATDWSSAYSTSTSLVLSGLSDGIHTLKVQVQDSLGNWTDLDDITLTVKVPPEVVSVSPEDQGTAGVTTTIKVTFSEAMAQSISEAAFSINPEIEGIFSWEDDTSVAFTPGTVLTGGTEYTITIAATAADLAGNTLESSFSWSFTTLTSSTGNYKCTLTGYAYMGNTGVNSSNTSYLIAGPMEYYYGTSDMWGYAWIKFGTIGAETVDHAYLVLDLLGVGSMSIVDASEEYPGNVYLYSPGDTDVADLGSDSDLRESLHDTLKSSSTPFVSNTSMTVNGTYYLDITDVYNKWVSGETVNNGIILMSDSENENAAGGTAGAVGVQFAATDGELGDVPYITFKSPYEAPTISSTTPDSGATGVDVGTAVTITFDKSMDTDSVADAFLMASVPASSDPTAVEGTMSWNDLGSVLTFTPSDLLSHETTYAVAVEGSAMDTDGNNLASAYAFSFTTGAYVAPDPKVSGSPEGTLTTDTATLTISGDGVYGYRYALDDDDWSDTYDTSETLSLTDLTDGQHTLAVQVLDSLGNWTDLDSISWTVAAPPTIDSVSPEADGTASVLDTIVVTFSEAMDQASVEAAFSITPTVAGSLSWENTALVFTPSVEFDSETQYTVTIGADAADLAGYTLASAYSWSFTTLASSSVRCEATADTYVLYGGMGSGKGYPQGTSLGKNKLKAGAVSIVDARIMIRFDLSPITDLGLSAEDIESAYLIYTMGENDQGMDVGPPAPDGTAMYGFVHVLDTESYEKYPDDPPDEPFYWTEAVSGDGYVTMYNKPWYVEGSPWVLATHSTGSGTTGKIDIAPILKGFVDGRWENNGIEIRDQDDGSWVGYSEVYGAEYGDGYSWHIASREDTENGPYLLVTYSEDKLRIEDRTNALAAMESQSQRTITASGGDSQTYRWTVAGPDGGDLTSSALSASTGATVTFTAPDDPGLYTVSLVSGDEEDSISIGVGTAVSSSIRAPLYLNSSQASREKALVNICDTILDQMGRCDSLGKIDLTDESGSDSIGGTGMDCDARVAITVIDDLSTTTTVSLDGFSGNTPSMEISSDSLTGISGTVYAVIVDTGRNSFGSASDVYMFELFDESGAEIDSASINGLELSIPFDTTATGSTSFENGYSMVMYADTVSEYFAVDTQSTVDNGDLNVDDDTGQVALEVNHLSVFGLYVESGSETTVEDGESDSLGSGCFIGSLLF